MKNLAPLYRDELLNNVIPFWMKFSKDEQYGGYFTSLDRDGTVYDTDKWMWLQGREMWTFAAFYRHIEQRREWLDMAQHGAKFIQRFGSDSPEGVCPPLVRNFLFPSCISFTRCYTTFTVWYPVTCKILCLS